MFLEAVVFFSANKTKLVCTIGPASDRPAVLREMLRAGMNVARLNFSHGDFDSHARVIADLREAADEVGRRLAIMADLPGPKIRIGELSSGPVELTTGDTVVLTTEEIAGDAHRFSVNFDRLPLAVHADDKMFLNDGLISLKVVRVDGMPHGLELASSGY